MGFSATPPQKAPDPPLPKQTPIVTAVPDPPVVSPVRRFNDKVPTVRLDNPVASPGALLPANKPSSMHVARATAGQPSPLQNPEVIPTLPTANRYVSRPSLKQSAPPQSQEIIPTLQTTQDNPDLSASKKVARATTGQSPSLENQETIPTLQTTQSLTWARTLLEDGQYEEAERVVRNQVAQSGESATALGILAILEQKRGNLETSNRYYNRLLRLEPDQYRWWLGLAVNKDQSGSKNEAVSFYRHVVKMNNVDDQVFRFAQERLRILEAKSAPER
ncbi:MAG TPA: hypothetical protein HPQ00_07250 [Magnetococcales bacterium]|nr:hypothetical protein [Magnetococcales bacterium]